MSDTSKVKHWSAWECEEIFDGNERFVLASDHDRIVAELKSREAAAYKVYQEMSATIASQSKVIENIKQALDNPATRPNEALVEIREAIEQEEGT